MSAAYINPVLCAFVEWIGLREFCFSFVSLFFSVVNTLYDIYYGQLSSASVASVYLVANIVLETELHNGSVNNLLFVWPQISRRKYGNLFHKNVFFFR